MYRADPKKVTIKIRQVDPRQIMTVVSLSVMVCSKIDLNHSVLINHALKKTMQKRMRKKVIKKILRV